MCSLPNQEVRCYLPASAAMSSGSCAGRMDSYSRFVRVALLADFPHGLECGAELPVLPAMAIEFQPLLGGLGFCRSAMAVCT